MSHILGGINAFTLPMCEKHRLNMIPCLFTSSITDTWHGALLRTIIKSLISQKVIHLQKANCCRNSIISLGKQLSHCLTWKLKIFSFNKVNIKGAISRYEEK